MAPSEGLSLFSRAIKWILSTPWASCVFFALVGTLSIWLLLLGSQLFTPSRLATGTVLGLAIGLALNVESETGWSPSKKRLINGIIGMLSGIAIALLLGFGSFSIVVSACIGIVLGATAKEWIYHVNFL